MVKDRFDAPRRLGGVLIAFALVLVLLGAYLAWGALRRGAAPKATITVDRVAVGKQAKAVADFSEPEGGLGTVRFELIQGERTLLLGERTFARKGPYSFGRGTPTASTRIEAAIGRDAQDWLKEGELTLRATADRMAGPLRSKEPVVVEKKVEVKLRPPRLELMSSQHYVHQGGAGVVIFRTSEPNGRSGVRAGQLEALSYPLPGGQPNDRFCLYAVPWELSDVNQIRVFAEDAAGNRVELPFVSIFKPVPAKHDTIKLTDDFLQKTVPAIAAETLGFDTRGSLLDQYLRINGAMRKENLATIAELARHSESKFLWQGPFLQMANTARRANFAETRTYEYNGHAVDQQTHLGYDLASLAHAPVPAPNSGKVVHAGWLGIYGNAVIIDHGYGLFSLCGHLSSVQCKVGELVQKGQIVAASGSTGLAGGDHLHLEIFLQGKSIDPKEWLDEQWIKDNLGTKLHLP